MSSLVPYLPLNWTRYLVCVFYGGGDVVDGNIMNDSESGSVATVAGATTCDDATVEDMADQLLFLKVRAGDDSAL